MLTIIAFLLGIVAAPAQEAPQDVEQCFGPFFGFERGSDRLGEDTERGLDGIVAHMKSPLWRHGWFVMHATVRDPNDRAILKLVKRRQATIRRELKRRGIASDRIRFAAVETVEPGYVDVIYVMSTVPRRVWDTMVSPNVMC